MADPVISSIVYTVTDTTISAAWTTDISADSNIFAGAKAGVDNGYAASGTSHQAIVAGLTPNTAYSCTVQSGATVSTPSSQTTAVLQTRIPILAATLGPTSVFGNTSGGDSLYSFKSSDGVTYCTMNDGYGFTGSSNGGRNSQIGKFTNNTTLAGALVNTIDSYTPGGSGVNKTSGTDGPSSTAMRAADYGLFGLSGHLFMFMSRNNQGGPPPADWYGNIIMDNADQGATWNKFTDPATFNANGVGPCDGATNADIYQFASSAYGPSSAVLYAADDGTLGYTTAGNQIDGANAYVYVHAGTSTVFAMTRWPRAAFLAQDNTKIEYWIGPAPAGVTVASFTNDSNWSSSDASATSVGPGAFYVGRIFFVPAINRYVASCNTAPSPQSNTTFKFFEAPTPIGPWTQFFQQLNNPQGWIVPSPMHSDLVANVATDAITFKMLYAGDFHVSTYYRPHFSTLTLYTAQSEAMTQLASSAFPTIENPLSDGGNFTTCNSMSALNVSAVNVCRPSTTSTHCGAYWSGAIAGTWPADQYSEATIAAYVTDGTGYIIPMVRQSSSANTAYRAFIINGTNGALFQAIVAGVAHTLDTFTCSPVAGDVWRLTVIGNVLTLTQNGTSIRTFTDTNNYVTAAGFPALDLFGATVTKQEASLFSAGAFVAVSPALSPGSGSHAGALTVTITGPTSSTIYYTTDGTTPTRSSSSIASGATISVATSATVKAISSITNFADSQPSSAVYTITAAPTAVGNAGSLSLRRRHRIYAI